MFVTNHVLSGVLIGRALKDRPVTAAVAGVASHLALDAVPHWGCVGTERFLAAAKRDGVIGLASLTIAVLSVERSARLATATAIAGAVLLDLDKPLGYFFGVNPFPDAVQRLHMWIQNESPEGLRGELAFGFVTAVADLATVMVGRRQQLG